MKYKVIIFDIDGTVAKHISSWRYIHERLGLWDEVAYKYQSEFLAGKISYRKFCALDAAHWKGLAEEKVRKIFFEAPYMKNAAHYIKVLKRMGFKLVAISTGLQYMADRIKRELGFDYVVSNRLITKRGRLTGGVKINITHGAKGKIVKRALKKFHVKPHEAISVGDGSGDIPLVRNSGYSIAFNSVDKEFLKEVDYVCRTIDFKEVFENIVYVSGVKNR